MDTNGHDSYRADNGALLSQSRTEYILQCIFDELAIRHNYREREKGRIWQVIQKQSKDFIIGIMNSNELTTERAENYGLYLDDLTCAAYYSGFYICQLIHDKRTELEYLESDLYKKLKNELNYLELRVDRIIMQDTDVDLNLANQCYREFIDEIKKTSLSSWTTGDRSIQEIVINQLFRWGLLVADTDDIINKEEQGIIDKEIPIQTPPRTTIVTVTQVLPVEAEKQKDRVTIPSFYEETYRKITSEINATSYENETRFEIIPLMIALSNFGTQNVKSNKKKCIDDLKTWAEQKVNNKMECLDTRLKLYDAIVQKSITPRGDWCSGNTSAFNNDPVLRCVVALGDILVNPNCINNYKNMPLMTREFDKNIAFSTTVIQPIIPHLAEYWHKVTMSTTITHQKLIETSEEERIRNIYGKESDPLISYWSTLYIIDQFIEKTKGDAHAKSVFEQLKAGMLQKLEENQGKNTINKLLQFKASIHEEKLAAELDLENAWKDEHHKNHEIFQWKKYGTFDDSPINIDIGKKVLPQEKQKQTHKENIPTSTSPDMAYDDISINEWAQRNRIIKFTNGYSQYTADPRGYIDGETAPEIFFPVKKCPKCKKINGHYNTKCYKCNCSLEDTEPVLANRTKQVWPSILICAALLFTVNAFFAILIDIRLGIIPTLIILGIGSKFRKTKVKINNKVTLLFKKHLKERGETTYLDTTAKG